MILLHQQHPYRKCRRQHRRSRHRSRLRLPRRLRYPPVHRIRSSRLSRCGFHRRPFCRPGRRTRLHRRPRRYRRRGSRPFGSDSRKPSESNRAEESAPEDGGSACACWIIGSDDRQLRASVATGLKMTGPRQDRVGTSSVAMLPAAPPAGVIRSRVGASRIPGEQHAGNSRAKPQLHPNVDELRS